MSEDIRSAGLQILRLDAGLPLPAYAKARDAGLDLLTRISFELSPGERKAIPTGVAVAIPEGYTGMVLPRSGIALKSGVTVLNSPGLIDSGYRGEISVLLINHHPSDSFRGERGERIAQLVILPVATAKLTEVAQLSKTERGEQGFGHTGR